MSQARTFGMSVINDMNILGVGPLELILVLLVIFLVLGPEDIVSTGKKLGRFLSAARKSEVWTGVTRVNKTLKDLPSTLIREAELEDVKREIEQNAKLLNNTSAEIQSGRINEIKADIQSGLEIKLDKKGITSSPESSDKTV